MIDWSLIKVGQIRQYLDMPYKIVSIDERSNKIGIKWLGNYIESDTVSYFSYESLIDDRILSGLEAELL